MNGPPPLKDSRKERCTIKPAIPKSTPTFMDLMDDMDDDADDNIPSTIKREPESEVDPLLERNFDLFEDDAVTNHKKNESAAQQNNAPTDTVTEKAPIHNESLPPPYNTSHNIVPQMKQVIPQNFPVNQMTNIPQHVNQSYRPSNMNSMQYNATNGHLLNQNDVLPCQVPNSYYPGNQIQLNPNQIASQNQYDNYAHKVQYEMSRGNNSQMSQMGQSIENQNSIHSNSNTNSMKVMKDNHPNMLSNAHYNQIQGQVQMQMLQGRPNRPNIMTQEQLMRLQMQQNNNLRKMRLQNEMVMKYRAQMANNGIPQNNNIIRPNNANLHQRKQFLVHANNRANKLVSHPNQNIHKSAESMQYHPNNKTQIKKEKSEYNPNRIEPVPNNFKNPCAVCEWETPTSSKGIVICSSCIEFYNKHLQYSEVSMQF